MYTFRFLFTLPLKPFLKNLNVSKYSYNFPSIDLVYRQIILPAAFHCLPQVKKHYWKERQKGKAINSSSALALAFTQN